MAEYAITDPGTSDSPSMRNSTRTVEDEGTGVPMTKEGFQPQIFIEGQVQDLLKSLSTRGKGEYYCPYGIHCRGGGVDVNGNLVTYERNSNFRYASSLAFVSSNLVFHSPFH